MSSTFDFTKCLAFIESADQTLYHPGFKVIPDDYEIIYKLLLYFLNDTSEAMKYNISFRKGILLSGSVGCGKTSLMNIIKHFKKQGERFIMRS